MVLTTPDPKRMARTLGAELRSRREVELGHGECLEIVARMLGHHEWNVLAAAQKGAAGGETRPPALPWKARNATIPVLRIFDVDAAEQFYTEFLGFHRDFGGPTGGPGTPYYGQFSRAGTSLHLAEHRYDPGPGATVLLWIQGIDELRTELECRREEVRVWGPAVWVPEIETAPWGARVLTVPDPFGNHLRFNEPTGQAAGEQLPRWAVPPTAPRGTS